MMGYLCFGLEVLIVVVLAVLSFLTWWFFLLFIALFLFVIYDIIYTGPLFGRFLDYRTNGQPLGELSQKITSFRMPHCDEQGCKWTRETVTEAVLQVFQNEGYDRKKISLSMQLSEFD